MLDKPRFTMRSRVELESIEEKTLAPYASLSRGAHATRRHEEPEHPYRTAFQRDRDRIIHSRAFRRLKHKRQVFLTTESDHYRTRITHTLEVSQLSRTMARALGLNEDLVEAIALGHDLGHTPFGHLGEVVLNEIMSGKTTLPGQTPGQRLGGFKHNYQSVRVVDELEMKYAFKGLNLTAAVREGILKHTRLRRGEFDFPDFQYQGLNFECDAASTLEAQVVAVCDEIAQRTHDLEDGIRAGLVDVKEVRELRIVQRVEKSLGIAGLLESDKGLYRSLLIRGLINALVDDVAGTTLENLSRFAARKKRLSDFDEEIVRFSREMDPLQKELNKFIYKRIIDLSHVQWSDDLGRKLISRLFLTYFRFPEMLPDYVRARVLPGGAGGPGQKSPSEMKT
ncbi:MAG: dNTP triphosphohydrolase [Calditrichaeota bacterium]|nr:MAG: dNTP triphosphohydrolase [Calditrichota bacterium]